jgi:hypothetical protein
LREDAGNAECTDCGADYWMDGQQVTLLGPGAHDPFGMVERFRGRVLDRADLPWLAQGKTSQHPGRVCQECGLEFDAEGGGLRLIWTEDRRLIRAVEAVHTLERWHLIAKAIPAAEEVPGLEARLSAALLEGYMGGQIGFDGDLIWRGGARREDGAKGMLTIDARAIAFSGFLHKREESLATCTEVWAEGDTLGLGLAEPTTFEIEPQVLRIELECGPREIELGAPHLAVRLRQSLMPQ